MSLKEPADKTKMFRNLLKGQALSYFEYQLRKRLDAEDSDISDKDLLEIVIRDIGLEYIPKRAICVQKYYMRRGLYMGSNTSVQQFVERLNDLNRYLLFSQRSLPNNLIKMRLLKSWIKLRLLNGMRQ